MSDLTLPEVRRCLQRVVVAATDGRHDVVTAEARVALHLLSAWSENDMDAARYAWRQASKDKGRSTPHAVLHALDPQRARRT